MKSVEEGSRLRLQEKKRRREDNTTSHVGGGRNERDQ
jgi:hypothetical protein